MDEDSKVPPKGLAEEYVEELLGGSFASVIAGMTLKDWLFYGAVLGLFAGVLFLWTAP